VSRAILVRGVGAVCALGRNLAEIRAAGDRSGYAGPAGDAADFPAPFDPARDLPRGLGRRLGRQPALAMASLLEATEGAGGMEDAILVLGTAHGPVHETYGFLEGMVRHGARFASPAQFASSLHNTMSGVASRELGIRGATIVVCNGEASFESALLVAVAMLRAGRAGRAVVAASDTCHPIHRAALRKVGLLCEDARPPDPVRMGGQRGVRPGEGAGALLLESAPEGSPGVRIDAVDVGAAALEPRDELAAVRLLSGGDARGVVRHRAWVAAVAGVVPRDVSFPAARLGAFGSLGAVVAAVEADRLARLPAAAPGGVLLLQVPADGPPAAVVLRGGGGTA
jgi:3-oxoacyl-(acyl-carrier-protein) synthase